ncbi:alpha/beta hydrolase [Escherichia coli]|nr:alpha/beta hydrolase [Escherichia coli]HBB7885122.1 alpha/beta hydrolase [Escherichia coli]
MNDIENYGNRYHVLQSFPMPQLASSREIRILLPASYYESDVSYPVLYMHDGQNLFDKSVSFGPHVWDIPEAVDAFFPNSQYDGVIIVGIDNASSHGKFSRMDEYSPWPLNTSFPLPGWDPDVDYSGGKGALYVDFIVNTLKNYIDSNFRTLPDRNNTAIAGSSMGAYISLFAAILRLDVFSKVGVFSPALWFNDSAMLNFIQENNIFADLTVYLDVGTLETSGMREDFPEVYISGAEKLCVSLRKQRNVTIDYHLWGGDTHSESAWAKRFPEILKLFYC